MPQIEDIPSSNVSPAFVPSEEDEVSSSSSSYILGSVWLKLFYFSVFWWSRKILKLPVFKSVKEKSRRGLSVQQRGAGGLRGGGVGRVSLNIPLAGGGGGHGDEHRADIAGGISTSPSLLLSWPGGSDGGPGPRLEGDRREGRRGAAGGRGGALLWQRRLLLGLVQPRREAGRGQPGQQGRGSLPGTLHGGQTGRARHGDHRLRWLPQHYAGGFLQGEAPVVSYSVNSMWAFRMESDTDFTENLNITRSSGPLENSSMARNLELTGPKWMGTHF